MIRVKSRGWNRAVFYANVLARKRGRRQQIRRIGDWWVVTEVGA